MLPEQDLVICRCEEVTIEAVKQAIEEGALTVDAVKRSTRAGMGLCQGRTCGRLVARLLAEAQGLAIGQVAPASHRPPVRPLSLTVLAGEEEP